MTSLAAHLAASLLLFPTGLRRLRRSSALYHHDPSLFRSKPWYFSDPNFNNLDLYALLLALPIASLSQFLLSGPKFSFLHQSSAIFLFWLLLLFAVLRQHLDPFLVSESFLFVFAGIAFLAEYSFAGIGGIGIGGVAYGWLGDLTLLCAGSCLCLAVRPAAFFAEFLLGCGLVLKGSWVLQIGLNLYSGVFGLRGCGDLRCDLEEDGLRAVAVIGFVFMVHVIVIVVVGLVVFVVSARSGEAGGSLPEQLDSESLLVDASEFEI